ncbi:hypothetical protein K491DRAFT_107258 [Lophiostoma macrostomum CBS 122681]|uniref:Uncharacterized protein n=1 Tax=Lophiostoma macrostomum CBS 122681 TaxID=1314788 RepID=A0A6A6TL52_9PLEO|nr:hypothetical protein K491DRAFT_107258 [Lophiostoma macrostomum CBS 122681]
MARKNRYKPPPDVRRAIERAPSAFIRHMLEDYYHHLHADNMKERLDKTMSGDSSVRQGQPRTVAEQTTHDTRHMYTRTVVGLINSTFEDRGFSLPAADFLRRAKEAETPTSPSKTAKSKEPDPKTPPIGTSTAFAESAPSGKPQADPETPPIGTSTIFAASARAGNPQPHPKTPTTSTSTAPSATGGSVTTGAPSTLIKASTSTSSTKPSASTSKPSTSIAP